MPGVSCRYVLAWMGCLGLMNVYFCRINLSMAMVAMVGVDRPTTTSTNGSCSVVREVVEEVSVVEGEFTWSKQEQGLVTGSYYWGYAACQVGQVNFHISGQVPGAWLASRFGFRRVFGFSMLVSIIRI